MSFLSASSDACDSSGAASVSTAPVVAPTVEAIIDARHHDAICRAQIEASIARANACEPWLHAFTFRPASYACTPALDGPLAALPIGVKDLIATHDMPTTYGSPVYENFRPAQDAWIVARMREMGGVVFGKTVSTEFAWREPGPTVNPWNPLHTPGGSSSGSAAAVGAGIVPLAIGTQTVGSVIRPAAFCGVVGFKPSHGRIPLDGVHPLAPSLDHLGFFARRVALVAAAYAVSAVNAVHTDPEMQGVSPASGHEPTRESMHESTHESVQRSAHELTRELTHESALKSAHRSTHKPAQALSPESNDLQGTTYAPDSFPEALANAAAWHAFYYARKPVRLAVVRTPYWDRASDDQKANFAQALGMLRDAGVELVEREPFNAIPTMVDALMTILRVEAHEGIGPIVARHPELVSKHMHALTSAGADTPRETYLRALALQRRSRAQSAALIGDCDAIVTIPATGEAPLGLLDTGDASFCAPWSLMGVPAITLPSGRTKTGLPLGLQLVAPYGQDLDLLRIAAWVETRF